MQKTPTFLQVVHFQEGGRFLTTAYTFAVLEPILTHMARPNWSSLHLRLFQRLLSNV